MSELRDVEWFKNMVSPNLSGYEVNYRPFDEEGDFGSLMEVEFISRKLGVIIDFWSLGWLGVFVWSYEHEEEILNVLLEPHQHKEKEELLKKMEEMLLNSSSANPDLI